MVPWASLVMVLLQTTRVLWNHVCFGPRCRCVVAHVTEATPAHGFHV
jgi:hypothetical protein